MKTTNGLQILDVYDEIYRNTERFEYPTECSSYTICPNCKKTVVLLTGYQSVVECDNCRFCWIIS